MTTSLSKRPVSTNSASPAVPISTVEFALARRASLRTWLRADIEALPKVIPDRKRWVPLVAALGTAPKTPTYGATSGPDNKPAILANGTINPGVMWAPSGEVYWRNDKDWSVAIVGAKMGTSNGAIVGNADQPGAYINIGTDRRVRVAFDNANVLVTAVDGLPASGLFNLLLVWQTATGTLTCYCNGVSIGTVSGVSTPIANSRLVVFGNSDGTNTTLPAYAQQWSDIMWWDCVLTAEPNDKAALAAYLTERYPSLAAI